MLISIKFSLKFLPNGSIKTLQHWFRWWLGAEQATSHCLNQWWLFYWHIYAPLSLNELKDVQSTTCLRPGDKPTETPLTPAINSLWPIDAIHRQTSWTTLFQVMVCRQLGVKPLYEPIVTSYLTSNFSYCNKVWHFWSKRSMQQLEKVHKQALRVVLNEYTSSYRVLLEAVSKPTLYVSRLKSIAIEDYNAMLMKIPNISMSFWIH